MILGVVLGTLSSIFIASPMAYIVLGRKIKEEPAEAVAVAEVKYKVVLSYFHLVKTGWKSRTANTINNKRSLTGL